MPIINEKRLFLRILFRDRYREMLQITICDVNILILLFENFSRC